MLTLDALVEEWHNLREPFMKYTAAQTVLNFTVIACQTEGNMATAAEDALKNMPFIAATNLGYAKCVDYITRKLGKHGRLGANMFSLAVTGAFYAYAAMTNDSDPTIPSTVAGIIGLYLTNSQVSQIQSSIPKEQILEDSHKYSL